MVKEEVVAVRMGRTEQPFFLSWVPWHTFSCGLGPRFKSIEVNMSIKCLVVNDSQTSGAFIEAASHFVNLISLEAPKWLMGFWTERDPQLATRSISISDLCLNYIYGVSLHQIPHQSIRGGWKTIYMFAFRSRSEDQPQLLTHCVSQRIYEA